LVEGYGSTSLAVVGGNYYLYANGTSSGPMVKYGAAPIVATSQAGAWAAIGAEQSGSGYLIAFKVNGADQYSVWNANSSGTYVSNAVSGVSGSSAALQSIETSFHQDLNGDGVVGLNNPTVPASGDAFHFHNDTTVTGAGTSHTVESTVDAAQTTALTELLTAMVTPDHVIDVSTVHFTDLQIHDFLVR
jgi:hypothetical protein